MALSRGGGGVRPRQVDGGLLALFGRQGIEVGSYCLCAVLPLEPGMI